MSLIKENPLKFILIFLSLSLLIRALYSLAAYYLPLEVVYDVFLVNLILAFCLLFYQKPLWNFRQKKTYISLIPSLLIVVGSFTISYISSGSNLDFSSFKFKSIIFSCVLIPIVEELVYRSGFNFLTRDKSSFYWSIYLSGLFFSMNHSLLSLSNFPMTLISLPLGPFLLGVICESIVLYSGSLLGAICFHSACNFTVYIFLMNDKRWLEWLSYLYLSGN